jgi:hypothetical protein
VLTIYQTARKLHRWVGLILALVLLMESVTGLILAESGLWGQEKSRPPMANPPSNSEQNKSAEVRNDNPPHTRTNRETPPTNGLNVFGIAKGLHQGRLGEWNAKWLVDLAAIGMIFLNLTGIYIAIPILRARSNRKGRP